MARETAEERSSEGEDRGRLRKVLERDGITDILTKIYGSTNALNVVKATMVALDMLRSREETVKLRGVELE